MIRIIDYGAGNLRSVEKALNFLGFDAEVTSNPKKIYEAEKVILPGVGSFGDCMNSLNNSGLSECIQKVTESGTPFLGICLGLQLLFEASEESPSASGLGIFKGKNIRIPQSAGLKIPHMGWNSIKYDNSCPIFKDLGDEPYVYFVHSYFMQPENKDIISASANYGTELPVALHKNNVYAVQFHPEKSGNTGLKILKNFGSL